MAGIISEIAAEILRASSTDQGVILPGWISRRLAILATGSESDDSVIDAVSQELVRQGVALYRAMSGARQGKRPPTQWLYSADGERAVHVLPQAETPDEREVLREKGNYIQLITMNHPGLAPVLQTAYYQGFPYLVARLRQEMHMLARRPAGSLDPSLVMRVVRQVAEALEYAHYRGVIHGALDLDKVFLDDRGNATVLGIGVKELQRELRVSDSNLAASPLAPPEVARGQEPDPRSDVYAVAALLYLLLTGKQPVPGRPVTLSQSLPIVPPALDAELTRALSADPADRHKDLVEMNWALRLAMSTRRTVGGPAQAPQSTRAPRVAISPEEAVAEEEASEPATAGGGSGFPAPLPMPTFDLDALFEPVPMPEVAVIDEIEIPPPPEIPSVDWNSLLQPVVVEHLSSRPIALIQTDAAIMDIPDPLQAAADAVEAAAANLESGNDVTQPAGASAARRPQRRLRSQSS